MAIDKNNYYNKVVDTSGIGKEDILVMERFIQNTMMRCSIQRKKQSLQHPFLIVYVVLLMIFIMDTLNQEVIIKLKKKCIFGKICLIE